MKLVVGLGNPGPRYLRTRHNVGFRVVDALAARMGVALSRERFGGRWAEGRLVDVACGLLQPGGFMNHSGAAVRAALEGLPALDPAHDLVVVYDDLDLPLGRLRLRPAGGAGGHNGLGDVLAALARRDVIRLRVGIGRPEAGGDVRAWVLEDFPVEAERALPPVLERAVDAIERLFREGLAAAMELCNRRVPDPGAPAD